MTYSDCLEAGAVFSPQCAPASTHWRRSEICSLVSFPSGGILIRSCVWLSARIRRLCSASPGTIAGPELPPFNACSRESSCSPPIFASVWHVKHRLARMGRTRVLKNSTGSLVPARLHTGRTASRTNSLDILRKNLANHICLVDIRQLFVAGIVMEAQPGVVQAE